MSLGYETFRRSTRDCCGRPDRRGLQHGQCRDVCARPGIGRADAWGQCRADRGSRPGSACGLVSADSLQSLSGATSVTADDNIVIEAGATGCIWHLNPSVGDAFLKVYAGGSADTERRRVSGRSQRSGRLPNGFRAALLIEAQRTRPFSSKW